MVAFVNRERGAMLGGEADSNAFDIAMIDVGKQPLRVAIRRGPKDRPPLLLFNGVGASLELAKPFMRALTRTEAIIFDVPGIGGSPPPAAPYRPSTLARLAAQLLRQMGYKRADIGGVSWGGGQGPGGTMEVPTLTIACHEGRPPADDIFLHDSCSQPVPARSPCPGSGPA